MNNNELIKNLKELSQIQPRSEWKSDLRGFLLSEIANAKQAKQVEIAEQQAVSGGFWSVLSLGANLRRVGSMAAVFVMIFGGVFTTISAYTNSLPGDLFYPLKITVEKTQLSFTYNEQSKVMLDMEFMGRRIDELAQVAYGENDSASKQEKVAAAVGILNDGLAVTQKYIKNLSNTKDAKDAVALANILNEKTNAYHIALSNLIPSGAGVESAISSIDQANTEALSVIVENHKEAGIPDSEVISKVEDKIKQTENKISEQNKPATSTDVFIGHTTRTQTATSTDPATALTEAREALNNNDLAGAVSKIKEAEASMAAPVVETITPTVDSKATSTEITK